MEKQLLSKKARLLCLVSLFLLFGGGASYASLELDSIGLAVGIDDPIPVSSGMGKGPVYVPTVFQDGYEIIFQSSHPAYTLYIEEDDVVVYSVVVSSSTTSVFLPSWLSGEYLLLLRPEDSIYYFYGDIKL